MTDPVRVLYIAGTGRTGSTVVGNILGQVPGCASLGEIRYVWERGVVEDRLCGCGEAFSSCPVWQHALADAFPEGSPDPRRAAASLGALLRVRRLRELREALTSGPTAEMRAEIDRLTPLYRALSEHVGAGVIVDGSKLPTYALLLEMAEGIDLHVLHLVRDPRAVAFSWRRMKELKDGSTRTHMLRQSTWRASTLWNLWNGTVEDVWGGNDARYRRVGYEGVMADPGRLLDEVLAFVGVEGNVPVEGNTVLLDATHTVAGNPNRLERGPRTLRLDEAWRDSMASHDRILCSAITRTRRKRYGYD